MFTPGAWGCGAFLIALLLAIVLIGILIVIYLLIIKPAGTLVVTYEFRWALPPPARPLMTPGPASVRAAMGI